MKLQANEATPRGFTLIELLVVIAIIGLLSSIVLASLSTARLKAKDASAVESMVAMRAEAELSVASNGTYPFSLCPVGSPGNGVLGPPLDKLTLAVSSLTPSGAVCRYGGPLVAGRIPSWSAHVVLNNGGYFCVDSSGFGGALAGTAGSPGGVNAIAQGNSLSLASCQ